MATSSPRADVAASRRAEKDALEREHHTRYMLNQLQQSHDALRLSTASSAATVETLQAELSSAEAQSDASRREVKELRDHHALRLQELEAELQATRQGRASSPFRPLPSSPLRISIPSEREPSSPSLSCANCSRTIISPAAQLQSRSDRACSPFLTVAEPEGRRVRWQGVDEADEGEGGGQQAKLLGELSGGMPSTAAPAAAAPTAAPAASPPAAAPAAAPASPGDWANALQAAALSEEQLAAQLRRQHTAAKALACVHLRSQLLLKRRLRQREEEAAAARREAREAREAAQAEMAEMAAEMAAARQEAVEARQGAAREAEAAAVEMEAARVAATAAARRAAAEEAAEVAVAVAVAMTTAAEVAAVAAAAAAEDVAKAAAKERGALERARDEAEAAAAHWRQEWEAMGEQLEGAVEQSRHRGTQLAQAAAALAKARDEAGGWRAVLRREAAMRKHAQQARTVLPRPPSARPCTPLHPLAPPCTLVHLFAHPTHPIQIPYSPLHPLPSAQVHSVLLRLLGAARSRVARLESAFGALAAAPPSRLAAAAEEEEGAALRLLFSTDMARL